MSSRNLSSAKPAGSKPATPASSAPKSAQAAAKPVASSSTKPAAKPTAKVAGAVKPIKTAAKPKPKADSGNAEAQFRAMAEQVKKEKEQKEQKYRNLVDPTIQQRKKQEYIEAFKKLQIMSIEELQVEFIVCIRAEHYRDALMYSEILLEKDPGNTLVQQFQPLLANLSVQANERLVEDSDDEDEDEEEGEEVVEDINGEDGVDGEGNEEEESDSDSDDPETAWMWSDTWRTDPDDADTGVANVG